MQIKNREPNDKELGQLISLTKKILKEAKMRGIELSKARARKLAAAKLGFVDQRDFENLKKEIGTQQTFSQGMKTVLPKYRDL